MPHRVHYRHVRDTTASPDTVFAVLDDVPRWRSWAPLVAQSSWEDPSVVGVGAVRLLGSRPVVMREQVTVHQPGRRHGYTLLSDRPARDYQAVVELTPTESGTRIEWSGSFVPSPPGVGHAYGLFVRHFIGRLADALVAEAERRS